MLPHDWPELRERILVHEDDDVLVVDKPVGISVVGERHDTDLLELSKAAGEVLYPAHRIDKVTSGALLLARNLPAHGPLTRQFNARTVGKGYLAIVRGTDLPDTGRLDLPLFTAKSGRVRIAALREHIRHDDDRGWYVDDADLVTDAHYPSVTRFTTLHRGDGLSLLLAVPETGRRHQLRVHLAWIGHAILGDPLFTPKSQRGEAERTHLHAMHLAFDHGSGERLTFDVAPGEDFWAPLDLSSGARESLIAN